MSLFGSGRREGILTVLGMFAFALLVHAVGWLAGMTDGFEGDLALARGMAAAHSVLQGGELPLWDPRGAGAPLWAQGAELLYPPWWLLGRGHDAFWLPALVALHTALAAALAFRFLRSHGRSRYASFVCGAAYGLGAHVGSLSSHLPELAALALAPLPLEVLLRVLRNPRQRHLAAWLGPALALPFFTGGVVTASCVLLAATAWLLAYAHHERLRRGRLCALGLWALGCVTLLTAPMWLGAMELPRTGAQAMVHVEFLPTLRRVAGPLLLFFLLLGAMRRQRGAPTERWLLLAGLGAAFAAVLPFLPSPLPGPAPWQLAPEALWWPVHLSLVLLASNGLDDFLDLPMRRRAATAWTLALCALVAPIAFALGERTASFHLEAAVLMALAALFALWRALGILRFKTVVAAAALAFLSAATLFEQAKAVRDPLPMPTVAALQPHAFLPAAPLLEPLLPTLAPAAAPAARLVFDVTDAGQPAPQPAPTDGDSVALHALPFGYMPRRDADADCRLVAEGANFADYAVDLPAGNGALVVPATWTPGWRAIVDGRPSATLATREGARAVLLSRGSKRVRLEFRPLASTLGLQLACCGAALSALLAGWLMAVRFFSSRKNAALGRRSQSANTPPKKARTAIATKAEAGSRS